MLHKVSSSSNSLNQNLCLQFKHSNNNTPRSRRTCAVSAEIRLPHLICHGGESSKPQDRGDAFGEEHGEREGECWEIARREDGVGHGHQEREDRDKDVEDYAAGDVDGGGKVSV